jgi:hypothetical protein
MTDTEYKKEIMIQRIEMHRRVQHLEVEAFKGKISPITSIFSLGQEASQALGSVGSLVKTLTRGGQSQKGIVGSLGSLITVALPLVELLFGKLKK